MKVIGLTGGTGSGKSVVSRFLKEMGAVIVDADHIFPCRERNRYLRRSEGKRRVRRNPLRLQSRLFFSFFADIIKAYVLVYSIPLCAV